MQRTESVRADAGLLAGLTLLATVFALALTFATLELPLVLGRLLAGFFPDIHPVIEPVRIEEFMATARPLGYACLGLTGLLIGTGFITGRRGLSLLGSAALFLPTFGYFFVSMFFLAGLGIIRVPFIPFWEGPVSIINLGDVIYLPYMGMVYPFWLLGIDVRMAVAWVCVGLGLLVFILGTVAWFYGKINRQRTVDFWIYQYSRHPQYLGFMVWSYGVMLAAALQPVVRAGQNPGASLPWLLTALVIVGVAWAEEGRMKSTDSQAYVDYSARTPFLLPLPGFIVRLLSWPTTAILGKNQPETGREILAMLLVYTLILVALSLPFVLAEWPPYPGWSEWPAYRP